MVETASTTVSILGATGSIGRATADVLATHSDRVEVVSVVGGRDPDGLATVARRLGAKIAAIADPAGYRALSEALSGTGIECAAGPAGVEDAAARPAAWTMASIAGTAGLGPTVTAVRRGGRIALATKECVVCAGSAFLAEVEASGAVLVPVDSEHNAIFQLLVTGHRDDLDRVTLTASGGPFRTWPKERILQARPEDALKHPTWAMGAKITIDSASLMNKGLELIEAKLLFDLAPETLDVLVHPQSIIHGLVSFRDGSVIAHMAPPDMRVPISHALGWPDERLPNGVSPLDLAKAGTLTFEAPDEDRFPALRLAKAAMARGGTAPTILNAANEIAVAAFLDHKIPFMGIPELVERTLERAEADGLKNTLTNVAEALEVDGQARQIARSLLPEMAARAH